MKRLIKESLRKAGNNLVLPHIPAPAELPDPRLAPALRMQLATWMADLKLRARTGDALPDLRDCGLRVFSQFEEDGYLMYLASVLELQQHSFVEIGADDGMNSNCANLAMNLGWHGLFIDGNDEAIARGREFYAEHPDTFLFPPKFVNAFITAENINDLVSEAGFSGQIGICSIDIDGNDCWVWNALEAISPAVVIIETHIEYGNRNIAVPYDPDYCYPGRHADYNGASGVAMLALAHRKGYRLVGANRYGFNLIFVRRDLHPERVPEVSLESILVHPRHKERLQIFEAIKDWEFVEEPFGPL